LYEEWKLVETKNVVVEKFECLPEGYTFSLEARISLPGSDCNRYGVVIITPGGQRHLLVGPYTRRIVFAGQPEKVYLLGDIEDVLVPQRIGAIEYCYHLFGYGERTKEYLDFYEARIALVRREYGDKATIGDNWSVLGQGGAIGGEMYICEMEGLFVAAFQVGHADSFCEYRFYQLRRKTPSFRAGI